MLTWNRANFSNPMEKINLTDKVAISARDPMALQWSLITLPNLANVLLSKAWLR